MRLASMIILGQMLTLQGSEDAPMALIYRSLSAKEPLIMGSFAENDFKDKAPYAWHMLTRLCLLLCVCVHI